MAQVCRHARSLTNRGPPDAAGHRQWIGGTRPGNAVFVPPPPERVPELLAQLERFTHGHRGSQAARELGIVTELTGQKKNRSFSYRAYVDLLGR